MQRDPLHANSHQSGPLSVNGDNKKESSYAGTMGGIEYIAWIIYRAQPHDRKIRKPATWTQPAVIAYSVLR
jgi:hypothetical protein